MNLKEKIVTLISYLLHPKKRRLISIAKRSNRKIGLEVGGPSAFFAERSYLPFYLYAKRIDGVNFSDQTVWEGSLEEGHNYSYYKKKFGYQYISEASNLPAIKTNQYDFLASCHCLEHTANPLKALNEWNRVLKHDGLLALILPDKNHTFDKNRPYTSFEHLKNDFNNNIDEGDTTHFNEVMNLHIINNDKGVQTIEQLDERTKNNILNRCVHHHVFNFETIEQMLHQTGFKVIYQQWVKPFHLVTIAKKLN